MEREVPPVYPHLDHPAYTPQQSTISNPFSVQKSAPKSHPITQPPQPPQPQKQQPQPQPQQSNTTSNTPASNPPISSNNTTTSQTGILSSIEEGLKEIAAVSKVAWKEVSAQWEQLWSSDNRSIFEQQFLLDDPILAEFKCEIETRHITFSGHCFVSYNYLCFYADSFTSTNRFTVKISLDEISEVSKRGQILTDGSQAIYTSDPNVMSNAIRIRDYNNNVYHLFHFEAPFAAAWNVIWHAWRFIILQKELQSLQFNLAVVTEESNFTPNFNPPTNHTSATIPNHLSSK